MGIQESWKNLVQRLKLKTGDSYCDTLSEEGKELLKKAEEKENTNGTTR